MAVWRDIDSDVRINGGLKVNSASIGSITNIESAVLGKLDASPAAGSATFIGNLNIQGVLSATSISGVDFSSYYTKTQLNTENGGGAVHWKNITNVPSALGEWNFTVDGGATTDKVSGGETVQFVAGTNISLSNAQDNQITISSKPYNAGTGLGILNGNTFYNSDPGSSQNIFKSITDGSSTISASTNNDSLTIVGSGATTVSYDVANKKITISSTDRNDNTTYSLKSGESNLLLENTTFSFKLTPSFTSISLNDSIVKTKDNADGINIDTLYSNVSANTTNISNNSSEIGSISANVSSHIGATNPHNISLETARAKGNQMTGSIIVKTDSSSPFTIEHNSSSATTNTRFAIKNQQGIPTFTIDSDGNIVGKSITVETLTASTTTESEGDFTVNGDLNVEGSTNMGNDPSLDITNIYGKLTVYGVSPSVPGDFFEVFSVNPLTGVTEGTFLGTVGGVDVPAFKNLYDNHTHDSRYYTQAEIDSLLLNIGNIKATKQTISSGSKSTTWDHNYGSVNYHVAVTPYSTERHHKIANKTSNSLTIEIDDESTNDIDFDIVLIGG